MDDSWIEHRREDGERIGWIRMQGEQFVAVDVLGSDVTGEVEWLEAEEALEERGLSFLAEPWSLQQPDGSEVRVRITEVSPEGVRVVEDEFGAASAVGSGAQAYVLPFPIPSTLRLLNG
ncbi:hypothetical protein [Nesterenkonia alkaliphila]|uniref:Uncharacterized protein n=1 Tax=Nesterenkonia alkaliphila TaxID=1463631 RepID=A0A7K1UH05_9MICC|nr:hypothetical protein [Nesterenkonia alkaliphila]MVT25757.1 hypothetical protein [Nesterenkonia alkaliphila]GFZ93040.1 hypothetical protein GCM10011359_23030 [Nesterenkonia alkaliphila]